MNIPASYALAAVLASSVVSQSVQLVRDINQRPARNASSDPADIVEFNGVIYCTAQVGSRRHLHRVSWNGAVRRVLSETASNAISDLTVSGGRLFFNYGGSLWSVTESGGVPQPGQVYQLNGIYELTDFNGILYFVAQAPGTRGQLWRSDGTAFGTRAVTSQVNDPRELTPGASLLFFSGNSAAGIELWSTDGRDPGTRMVSDLYPGPTGSIPIGLTSFVAPSIPTVDQIYFSANHPTSGREPWKTLGTSVLRVGDVNPGSASSNPKEFGVSPTTVLFRAADGSSGDEPWLPCGLGVSCQLLDVRPGPSSSFAREFVWSGSRFYFLADDGNGSRVWQSDGTTSGTAQRADGGSDPSHLTVVSNDRVICAAFGGVGREPVILSASGAQWFDVNPGSGWSYPEKFFASSSGRIVFSADHDFHGRELWVIEGATARLLVDFETAPRGVATESSNPGGGAEFAGGVMFAADDGIHGFELWWSDGTANGTRLVRDLAIGPDGSKPGHITVAGNRAYFQADSALWRTDGTAAGTVALHSVSSVYDLSQFTAAGDRMFYVGPSPGAGYELMVVEPSAAPRLVRDIRLGGSSSGARWLTPVGRHLFFVADDGSTGLELWRSDGVSAQRVVDLEPGPGGARIGWIVALRDGVVMSALGELWRSDGTAAGTRQIADLRVGDDDPHALIRLGDEVLFFAPTGASRSTSWLYASNGTPGGTRLVSSATLFYLDLLIRPIRLGGLVLFVNRAGSAYELWRTDGTSGGTFRLGQSTGGSGGLPVYVQPQSPSGSRYAWFRVDSAATGHELWRTDGTVAGTVLIEDILPGSESSYPEMLGVVGSRMLLGARHPVHGGELLAIDVGASSIVVGQPCATGRIPTLEVPDLVLGRPARIQGRFAQPNSDALLLLSVAPDFGFPIPTPPGSHCVAWIDAGNATFLGPFATGAAGSWQVTIPVPDVAAFLGLELAWQALSSGAVPPFGYDLTNGVWTTIGR